MPFVSVIVPTQNRPSMLQEAVESALAQTFEDFEIIIVFNGASAESKEVGRRLRANPKVNVVEMDKGTLAAARNFGLSFARGEWIAFLDDDDIWLPRKLELQLDGAARTGATVVTCNFSLFNKHGDVPSSGLALPPPGSTFAETLMLTNCVSGGSAVIVKAGAIRRLGGFDAKLTASEDWDMWRRLAWDNEIFYVDERLVKYRRHEMNMTGNSRLFFQPQIEHFAKMLSDTPPRLDHMMPAVKERFFRFILYDFGEQGVLDNYETLFHMVRYAMIRIVNKATRGQVRRIYRRLRGARGAGPEAGYR